jgi:hypothetical protein
MRAFDLTRGSTRYQGVEFDDGSLAVRRLGDDPCNRITFTFEGISECEAELGIGVPVEVEFPAVPSSPAQQWEQHGSPTMRALARAEAVGERASASLERRLLNALATPGSYQPEDNEPEPEDVEA